jgi:L-2-hydroxyglutarate oxidase
VVNAAGLYADQIARQFGFSERYRILPFKGLYLYSDEPPGALRTNIYPVPDLRNPFVGVNFTVTNEGKAKIGQRQFRPCGGNNMVAYRGSLLQNLSRLWEGD